MARRRKGSPPAPRAAAPVRDEPPSQAAATGLLPWVLGLSLALQPLWLYLWATDEYETPKLIFLRCAALLSWAALLFDASRLGLARHLLRAGSPQLAFVLAAALSTALSVAPVVSLLGEYGSSAGLQSQIAYVMTGLAAAALRDHREVRRVLLLAMAGAVLSTGMALVEASGHEIGTFFGLTAEIPAHSTSGTFGNANYFAGYTVAIIPIAVHLVRDPVLWVRGLGLALAAASTIGVMLSGSRTGIMFVALLALWLVLYLHGIFRRATPAEAGPTWRLASQIALPLMAVIIVGAVLSKPQLDRVGSSLLAPMRSLAADRLHLWGPAVAMFKDHPLLGAGPDTYASEAAQYYNPRVYQRLGANVTARRAHSEGLNMLACLGGLGCAAWLWLFGAAVWQGIRQRQVRDVEAALPSVLAVGLTAGFGFNQLHFVTVGQAPLLFALAGMLLGPLAVAPRPGTWRVPVQAAYPAVGLCLGLMLFMARDGWQWLQADIALKSSVLEVLHRRPERGLAFADQAAALRPVERRYHQARAQMHLQAAQQATQPEERRRHLEIAQEANDRALDLCRAPLTLWLAVRVESVLGNVDSTAALTREALRRDPTRPGELGRMVEWFLQRGELEVALELFQLVRPSDPDQAAETALLIGERLVKAARGDPREALYLSIAAKLASVAQPIEGYADRARALLALTQGG